MQNRMKTHTFIAPYTTVNSKGETVQVGGKIEVEPAFYNDLKRLGFTEVVEKEVVEPSNPPEKNKKKA